MRAHVRRRERARRLAEVEKAVEYRRKAKAWLDANKLPPARRSRPAVVPALQALADGAGGKQRLGGRKDGGGNEDEGGNEVCVCVDVCMYV